LQDPLLRFRKTHLEYAAVVWSPPSKKNMRLLETVQRRATKLVPRIRNWKYVDRHAKGIRGHTRRLSGQAPTKCMQRANSFTNRVANEWNAVPAAVTDSDSFNQFKSRYDAYKTGRQVFVS
jgi:hypothetical protein